MNQQLMITADEAREASAEALAAADEKYLTEVKEKFAYRIGEIEKLIREAVTEHRRGVAMEVPEGVLLPMNRFVWFFQQHGYEVRVSHRGYDTRIRTDIYIVKISW